jgi:histidine triad (HIT) family protein
VNILAAQARRGLFSLARAPLAGWFVREVFAHMSFTIPVHRLRETPSLLAFPHPSPGYPVHILLVPKRSYRSLLEVPANDSQLFCELVETVRSLVEDLGLEEPGYRLVVNGGANQDVAMLHFHLISGAAQKGEESL